MDNLINLIKERPIVVPRLLLSNYKKLGITEEELIVIMVIMDCGSKVTFDPEQFASVINEDKKKIMMLIDSLCNKNVLSMIIEQSNKKTHEYISLEPLYDKLFNIIIDKEEPEIDESIFSVFESELGRPLSPMEYGKIKEWITSGNSNEMIALALKEAVMNGVSNFNYIDSILNAWNKKGYKHRSDILKEKESYRTKKETTKIFDTDWLNG